MKYGKVKWKWKLWNAKSEVVIFISEIEIEEMEGSELKRWVVVHFVVW